MQKLTALTSMILAFLKKMIYGKLHPISKNKPKPAYENQKENVRKIWNNEKYNDFGIERLLRLFLAISQFASLGLLIRHFAGKRGVITRKIAIEVYVLFKLLLPLFLLYFHLFQYSIVIGAIVYLTFDTIIYLLCLIFLTDVFTQPISYKRSIITLFMNYVEVGLNYAVIYSFINIKYPNIFFNKIFSDGYADGIYFSFATSATVGYGDLVPIHFVTKYIIVSQILVSIFFVSLFFTTYTSKANDPTYYNKNTAPKGRK